MLRPYITIVLLLVYPFLFCQTVRIEIRSFPANHRKDSPIYIAGSFNNWNPKSEQYRFQQDDKGNQFIILSLATGNYEYKVTRGGWHKVECSKEGNGIDNRKFIVRGDTTIHIDIDEWNDHFPAKPKQSTASKNVKILDTAFYIPQLNRTRRIWIYLPEDYTVSQKKYPVLYMHDGQNLFEDSSSFSGEWGVDEFMDTTRLKKCIVVGIDNGKEKRRNEYNPYDNEQFGKAEGDAYVDFIAKNFRLYINKHYRTKSNRKNTFIAGSSMGGLISMYAVLKYPKVFGVAGVFSPAFWAGPQVMNDIRLKGKKVKAKIYFYAGKQEGETMVPGMLKAFEEMIKVSSSKMVTVIRDDGKHNETTWRKEFPLFYEWVMQK